ncbi:hypothetical protein PGT21_020030 [Puccinia graminis f. sp. tritici]|uniref:Uncharacterized protein n=1 Tax=Puccinia graminis f. sp. tritici TaxID=56615 RepID=A0A5B0NCP1_PUCGR|nr:hypothetical protein PGT21_019696 [Puccinia graminis f. sp. tritici]KAA1087037.1 hypothetical protein PGT21_020030 [Puccinia graminis f. sp. tritici]
MPPPRYPPDLVDPPQLAHRQSFEAKARLARSTRWLGSSTAPSPPSVVPALAAPASVSPVPMS